MAKFKNKYRSESHRRPNWDYSQEAIYFLTIVTQNRVCNLGHIDENREMIYSDYGEIVHHEWLQSFEIRKELILHEYVIMPNHLHTLVEIVKTEVIADPIGDNKSLTATIDPYDHTDQPWHDIKRNMPIRQPKSISSFMAGFKSAVNTKIDDYIDANQLDIPKYNRNNHFFQPNYHDHIVRNETEYHRIKYYIRKNPEKWIDDTFYG